MYVAVRDKDVNQTSHSTDSQCRTVCHMFGAVLISPLPTRLAMVKLIFLDCDDEAYHLGLVQVSTKFIQASPTPKKTTSHTPRSLNQTYVLCIRAIVHQTQQIWAQIHRRS